MAKGLFGGGSGTETDPFLIEDAYDLQNIKLKSGSCYKLVRNINLDVPPFNEIGWQPIPEFHGVLNGNGMKIFNLRINKENTDDVGLFAKIYYKRDIHKIFCKISNLVIENAQINGRSNVGILVGNCYTHVPNGEYPSSMPTFEKIFVSGNVSGTNNVGGLIGYAYYNMTAGYNRLFVEDIKIDASFYLKNTNTYNAPLIAYLDTNLVHYLHLKDIIINSKNECSKGEATNTSSIINANNTKYELGKYLLLENCIYNESLWNGNKTETAIGKTSDRMILKEEFPNLELKKADNGTNTWMFAYGEIPTLSFMSKKYSFVKKDNDYYTYNTDSKAWVMKISGRVPTNDDAIKYGITSFDNIDRAGIDLAKTLFNPMIIVTYVQKSIGTDISNSTVDLTRVPTKDTNSKMAYTTHFDFNNINGDIYCLK